MKDIEIIHNKLRECIAFVKREVACMEKSLEISGYAFKNIPFYHRPIQRMKLWLLSMYMKKLIKGKCNFIKVMEDMLLENDANKFDEETMQGIFETHFRCGNDAHYMEKKIGKTEKIVHGLIDELKKNK